MRLIGLFVAAIAVAVGIGLAAAAAADDSSTPCVTTGDQLGTVDCSVNVEG